MKKENYLHLDYGLYIISDEDMDSVIFAVGNCSGVCCPESLQELREVFLDIKSRYNPLPIEGQHITPSEQFDTTNPDFAGSNMPF